MIKAFWEEIAGGIRIKRIWNGFVVHIPISRESGILNWTDVYCETLTKAAQFIAENVVDPTIAVDARGVRTVVKDEDI